jgi:hypothetical protein
VAVKRITCMLDAFTAPDLEAPTIIVREVTNDQQEKM